AGLVLATTLLLAGLLATLLLAALIRVLVLAHRYLHGSPALGPTESARKRSAEPRWGRHDTSNPGSQFLGKRENGSYRGRRSALTRACRRGRDRPAPGRWRRAAGPRRHRRSRNGSPPP